MSFGDASIAELFNTLKSFENASGALINPSKTNALWLGRNVGRRDKPFDLNWTDKCIKVLGLPIGNQSNLTTELWDNKIAEIRGTLVPWKCAFLSLKEKIIVIKQLILPKITYTANIYPPSEFFIVKIIKIWEDFLWNNKRPKIPTRILYLPVSSGGLGLPNLHFYIKALSLVWIKDSPTTLSTHWVHFFLYFFNQYLIGQNLVGLNFSRT